MFERAMLSFKISKQAGVTFSIFCASTCYAKKCKFFYKNLLTKELLYDILLKLP